jgi:riboflavin biosynthesis pyrimidine reductase
MKPIVICHMLTSVDGRIITRRWSPMPFNGATLFETLHEQIKGEAWMCGRVTAEGFAKGAPYPAYDGPPIPRQDFFAPHEADSYAVIIDAQGKLAWTESEIEGDHIVVVLTRGVPDTHLAGLRAAGISYLFGGDTEIDFAAVLSTIGREFGVRRLLAEGGGGLNGSLLKAGLIDGISLVICPAVDGLRGQAALFDYDGAPNDASAKGLALTLESCKPLEDGAVWLRYTVERKDA